MILLALIFVDNNRSAGSELRLYRSQSAVKALIFNTGSLISFSYCKKLTRGRQLTLNLALAGAKLPYQ